MKARHKTPKFFLALFVNVAMLSLGLVIALGLTEMFMRTFPNWLPTEVRVNPPARRVKAFINETYDLTLSAGDLFHYMRGKIMPLSPEQDRVVANVHMVTDANGFRNSLPEKATYGIVALGDSFTRASGVAVPWPQRLTEQTATDVLNLSDVGFGPQDELKILRQFGLKKQPAWVVMAYFEGNDLYDAAAYEQANPFILLRFGRYVLSQGQETWNKKNADGAEATAGTTYTYPIRITINHRELEMAFFSSYISWLSLNRETIAASQNYRLVTETILQVQELSEAAEANFLLVYLPSKSHVYLPYIDDAETLTHIFGDVPGLTLDAAGFVQFTNERSIPELTHQHMDDQSRLLAEFAAEQNTNFLNLTLAFQEEAGAGVELYYPFDTHWNQQGHDLAAEEIYNYMEVLGETRGKTPGP